jgi:hypothetical protein
VEANGSVRRHPISATPSPILAATGCLNYSFGIPDTRRPFPAGTGSLVSGRHSPLPNTARPILVATPTPCGRSHVTNARYYRSTSPAHNTKAMPDKGLNTLRATRVENQPQGNTLLEPIPYEQQHIQRGHKPPAPLTVRWKRQRAQGKTTQVKCISSPRRTRPAVTRREPPLNRTI